MKQIQIPASIVLTVTLVCSSYSAMGSEDQGVTKISGTIKALGMVSVEMKKSLKFHDYEKTIACTVKASVKTKNGTDSKKKSEESGPC